MDAPNPWQVTIMASATLKTWDGTNLPIKDIQIEAASVLGAMPAVAVTAGRIIVRRVALKEEEAVILADSLRAGGLFDQRLNKIEA
jgi:hypothetical protein